MRKFIGTLVIVLVVMSFAGCLFLVSNISEHLPHEKSLTESSILLMKLEGVILDPTDFLEDLRKYAKEDDIKGVLVVVNSPGGVVGPSQELYQELKRVREELKKPVVVSASSIAASGAYYMAVAADQIFTNPGTLMGSIGVIMEFANLERLYDWAKIERYVVKTGVYKDSGAEYRPMREDEKQLFQSMADEVLTQFVRAIAEGRKMREDEVRPLADGRVFTGETAVKLNLADKIGTYEDARRAIGQLAGLGQDPEMFEPPPKRPSLSDFLGEMRGIEPAQSAAQMAAHVLKAKLWGQPLFLLPGLLPNMDSAK